MIFSFPSASVQLELWRERCLKTAVANIYIYLFSPEIHQPSTSTNRGHIVHHVGLVRADQARVNISSEFNFRPSKTISELRL